MEPHSWYIAAWICVAFILILFVRGGTMVDITGLEKEVAEELEKEELAKAKSQLKQVERDIRNAQQLVENLQRKKKDLLVAISDGTN